MARKLLTEVAEFEPSPTVRPARDLWSYLDEVRWARDSGMARIAAVVGTRPEIVQMASGIHELRARHADHVVLHTGQHDDENLSEVFFEELDLPRADQSHEDGVEHPVAAT